MALARLTGLPCPDDGSFGTLLRRIGLGSGSVRVALTKERRFLITGALLSSARRRAGQYASGFTEHRLPMLELALVVAHGLDRFRVGVGQRFGDLLGGQSVVAR